MTDDRVTCELCSLVRERRSGLVAAKNDFMLLIVLPALRAWDLRPSASSTLPLQAECSRKHKHKQSQTQAVYVRCHLTDTAEAPRVPVDLCTPPEKETDRAPRPRQGQEALLARFWG